MYAIYYNDGIYPMVKIAMSEKELKSKLLRLRNDKLIIPNKILFSNGLINDIDVTNKF